MKLTITLSEQEQANIGGWVNHGLNDPAFAAYPWRIVLEERTQARFDEIAAQFTVPAVLAQVMEPGVGNSPLTYSPGVKAYYQATRDGRAGCSIASGGSRVWCALGTKPGGADISQTSAVGGVPYQVVKAGEYVTMWAEIDSTQSGLYNLAAP